MDSFSIRPSVTGQASITPAGVVVPTTVDGTVTLTWTGTVQHVEFDYTAAAGASLIGTTVAYTTALCDMGDAPESYGSAHALGTGTALTLGTGVTADLADKYSPDASADTDDALTLPVRSVAANPGTYTVAVPLRNTTPNAAVLQGWLDFDRSGTFDPSEGTTIAVPRLATSAALTWTATGTVSGPSFIRLRLHQNPTGVTAPTGASVGGEVEDYPVTINAVPVITAPAPPTLTNDNTPTIIGTGTPGGRIEVVDGTGNLLCTADVVSADGTWSCTLAALADGTHDLIPVATAPDGTQSTGARIQITVDTTPPPPPVITTPAGQSTITLSAPTIAGTSEPDTIVILRDENGDTVCSATASTDGTFTCTPSDLATGRHTISPSATDPAGNTTTGRAVTVTVDDVATTVTPSPTTTILSPTTVTPSPIRRTPAALPETGRQQTTIAVVGATILLTGLVLRTLSRTRPNLD